jgi:Ran GTPase-activating protein (RanGAP) involved in mRNA processing and transport
MMRVSNDSAARSTIDDGRALLSSSFLEFCAKLRNNNSSILPEVGQPLRICHLTEKEDIELADALLENTNVTYIRLVTEKYTKCSAEAMAKYVRTSKFLQRIRWIEELIGDDQELRQLEKMFCCFLPAFQECTSLKELHINFPVTGGPSSLALENMLTHTQSLRSLSLICTGCRLEDRAVAAYRSGLKRNTTLQELTLEFRWDSTTIPSILTSLREHPHLRRLCLHGYVVNLTGLETVLLSDTSKITELDIHNTFYEGPPMIGLTRVLRALGCRPTLTKLGLHHCGLGRDNARLLCMALCNVPSLQSLVLRYNDLGNAGLAELAPALYHNTSIKVLDISWNDLEDMESAIILRDIIRRNKTMTTLDLSRNGFGQTTGAVECIADGLVSSSTLLKLNLSSCALSDGGVSTLSQSLSSRNTTLKKLTLDYNSITSTGVGALLNMMEQDSHHITDLELNNNPMGNEGASLIARSLGNNALPNLTRLALSCCGIDDDGCIALVSALEQNTSLLQLDLRNDFSPSLLRERAFLALAESLPEIKVLQRVDFSWCTGLASATPLLLVGLRKNTSLFRFHVIDYAPSAVPPTHEEMVRCAGGWIQEIEQLGYRNRFRPLIRAPKEALPPRGVWPHGLARVATLPDVIFEVLRSKPKLVVPSEDTRGKKAAEDTGKRKRGDE